MHSIFGIDYGSRKAGTTACFWNSESTFYCRQSEKNKDADGFILRLIEENRPQLVAIDAPLSLPGVYNLTSREFNDYHYRRCDREIGAMSPMFLGGLTARAMALAANLKSMQINVIEVYPAGLVKHFGIREHYKKDVDDFEKDMFMSTGIESGVSFQTWHQVDAFLAWNSGRRWSKNEHATIGLAEEGVICI